MYILYHTIGSVKCLTETETATIIANAEGVNANGVFLFFDEQKGRDSFCLDSCESDQLLDLIVRSKF